MKINCTLFGTTPAFLLSLVCSLATAQSTASLHGIIKSVSGTPIQAATVTVKDMKTSQKYVTSCDVKGAFRVSNIASGQTYSIIITAIGYQTYGLSGFEAKEGVNNIPDIVLEETAQSLDDIVIIGYGQQKRANITGAISSVKADEIVSYPSGNFAEASLGKATGVQIVQNSASPGSSPQIKIRGTGTLTAGTNPLVVVDGFPLTEGTSLASIDPNTIESIEFLKDAASTAIYGSRGANGVILVQSKSGIKGKMQVNLNSYFGWQQRADNVKLVDAYEMAQYLLEARNTGYVNKSPSTRSINDDNTTRLQKGASKRELIPDYILPYLNRETGLTNTNWLDEVFQTAPMSSISLNMMGGTDKSQYSVTGNYFNQEGILIGSNYERYAANINLKSELSKRLNFSLSVNPLYSNQKLFNNDGGWNEDPLAISQISYPFFSPYNTDGSYAISQQIIANTLTDGALAENPAAVLNLMQKNAQTFQIYGNSHLKLDFLKDFSFKTSIGGNFTSYAESQYKPSFVGFYRNAAPVDAQSYRINNLTYNFLTENILNYNKKAGKSTIEIIAGQSFQRQTNPSLNITATGFPDDQIQNIAGGSAYNAIFDQGAWSLLSYFGRVNYNYNGKYMLMASLRRDGSSKFGADRKFGTFPAFSVGWVLSNESFFEKNNWVNYTKIRASYGTSGNNQIPNYGSLALLSPNNYPFNGTLSPGYGINTAANSNLSWELSQSLDFGLDLTVIKNLFQITADYYITNTRDLLLNVPVPEQSGYSFALQNIGKIRNWGFELMISTSKSIKFGKVEWLPSFNLTSNRNKVLALGDGQSQIITGASGLNFALTKVGGSIAEFYGYDVSGIYKNQEQIDNTPHITGTQVGDFINTDTNGDGKIDESDKISFGSTNPKFTYGIGNTFKYNGFELSFFFNGEANKKIYSRVIAQIIGSGEGFAVPYKTYFDNRFVPVTHPDGTEPTPNMGSFSNNRKANTISNHFLSDASYLRLRTLRLTYTLPQQFSKKIGLNTIQIYTVANNLLTLTPYKGFSVDAASTNPLLQGFDNSNYPVAKSYSLGLNVNF